MSTVLAINLNFIHDTQYKPTTYNEIWNTLEQTLEDMNISTNPKHEEREKLEEKKFDIDRKVKDILNT